MRVILQLFKVAMVTRDLYPDMHNPFRGTIMIFFSIYILSCITIIYYDSSIVSASQGGLAVLYNDIKM